MANIGVSVIDVRRGVDTNPNSSTLSKHMPNSPVARRHRRRFVARVGALVTVAAFAGALAPSAGAQSLSDKREQASELADQIEASDVQISGFAEQLNAATARYDSAQATVADAEVRIANAKAEVASIKQQLRESGASLYTEGGSGDAGIDFSEASDLARRDQYAEARSEREDRLLEELDAAQSDLRAQRADATKARDDAAAEAAKITAAKTQIETARAAQQALLDSVTGEIAAEVAAERARREEAARVKYASPGELPRRRPAQRQRCAGDRLRSGRHRFRVLDQPSDGPHLRLLGPGDVGVARGRRQHRRLVRIDVRVTPACPVERRATR